MITRLSNLFRSQRLARMAWWSFIVAAFALALYPIVGLLHAAWCAMTWGRFALFDYGIYTNMIWNSGHGEPFRLLVDLSYLKTHLSFSLGLIGYLYHLWDHPFLLALVQNLSLAGGTMFLWAAAQRHRLPAPVTAALLLFFTGYVFTQRALLCEFHGVGMYFLLVPWLYYCLRFARRWSIIPLVLLLGIREEAFLFVLPMLAHAAWRDRWKPGYLLLALAVGYGLLAITWLYPLINGLSLIERRQESLGAARLFGTWHGQGLRLRASALALTLLPLLPFVGRRCAPMLLYPSVALLSCLASGFWRQHGLLNHYSPPVMTMLAVGLLETLAYPPVSGAKDRRPLRAFLLVVITIGVHLAFGFLPGGTNNDRSLRLPHHDGQMLLHALDYLPKKGLLVTQERFAAYTANRRDLLVWKRFKPEKHRADLVLESVRSLPNLMNSAFMAYLSNGTYGVLYHDQMNVILQRNGPTSENKELLQRLNYRNVSIRLADTPSHHGKSQILLGVGWVRYWSGKGSRAPANVSYGGAKTLPAGSYEAVLRYRVEPPRKKVMGSWGEIELRQLNTERILAKFSIPDSPTEGFSEFHLTFLLNDETAVEVQATGMDAELWLDTITFLPADPVSRL